MRAAIFHEPRRIEAGERPDPGLREPTDAIVRVVIACVCGSDLWYYRGDSEFSPGPIGHEFIGVVEDVGADVTGLNPGDLVIAPFAFSDGTCPNCRHGITTACTNGGFFPMNGDGGEGEAVRVPLADGTLVTVTRLRPLRRDAAFAADAVGRHGHRPPRRGLRERRGRPDCRGRRRRGRRTLGRARGAEARRLGAQRIITLSRHADRQEIAKEFGATDIVAERGEEAVEKIKEMTGGVGVDATLECVGTGQSMQTALDIARAGSMVGFVGVPHGVDLPIATMFSRNVGVRGGGAPMRVYLPELLDDLLAERIDPGRVLDYETDLDGIADAYAAMDERRAIKSLVRVSTI
jgi:threonine dehydrogenase-like Zn-dependent dehydrogenase